MKLYYYTFLPNGEITEDILTARKNKNNYVVDDGVYGGISHHGSFKYFFDDENQILELFWDKAYMFSSKKIIINENLKEFAKIRIQKRNELLEAKENLQLSFK